jgi:hypothetical protein
MFTSVTGFEIHGARARIATSGSPVDIIVEEAP